jgi:hypothetical protein
VFLEPVVLEVEEVVRVCIYLTATWVSLQSILVGYLEFVSAPFCFQDKEVILAQQVCLLH